MSADPVKITVTSYNSAGRCVGSDWHVFQPAGGAVYTRVSQEALRPAACAVPDTCPQCGDADLEPMGGKHRCPVCGYLQPCCQS